MGKKAARLGDQGSGHDGFPPTIIISGSSNVFIEGKPAARVGDTLIPHAKPKNPPHPRSVAQGSSSVFINGRPAVFDGCDISCGGVIIGGSGTVFIGDKGIDASGAAEVEPKPESNTTQKSTAVPPITEHVNASGVTFKDAYMSALNHGAAFDPSEFHPLSEEMACNAPNKKVFAKSCTRPSGDVEANSEIEPVRNFGPLSFFFGSAHAAVLPPPSVVAVEALTVQAGSAGVAAEAAAQSQNNQHGNAQAAANKQLSIALTKAVGNFSDSVLDAQQATVSFAEDVSDFIMMLFRPDNYGDDTNLSGDELIEMGLAPSRIRISIEDATGGQQFPVVKAFHSNNAYIPVKKVDYDELGNFSVMLGEGTNGPTITWTPDKSDENGPQLTPPHHDGYDCPHIYTTPIPDDDINEIEVYPMPEERNWQDYILVFPSDSGVEPLYVVFKAEDRYKRGKVTGEGKDVTWTDGYWLGFDSNTANGQYIPTQVADKLKGREFQNFDEFREAFGMAVSECPDLMNQFGRRNQRLLKDGKAPVTGEDYHWESLIRYTLHHVM
ncbi:type VI secretion system PAAR protein [Photobacterium nomapromontoriensis]|uniref:type VI secretion system PAAR protein n=1 Tax=Photobacterium nomapromontoriensis TaxID=2910237 RepID=UPI003D13ADD8